MSSRDDPGLVPDQGFAVLWVSQPFVTQPGIGTQRMQGKILCPFCQFDFMNVNGIARHVASGFLEPGLLFPANEPAPRSTGPAIPKLLHSPSAIAMQPPPHSEHR